MHAYENIHPFFSVTSFHFDERTDRSAHAPARGPKLLTRGGVPPDERMLACSQRAHTHAHTHIDTVYDTHTHTARAVCRRAGGLGAAWACGPRVSLLSIHLPLPTALSSVAAPNLERLEPSPAKAPQRRTQPHSRAPRGPKKAASALRSTLSWPRVRLGPPPTVSLRRLGDARARLRIGVAGSNLHLHLQ